MLHIFVEHYDSHIENPTHLIHFSLLVPAKPYSLRIGILVVVENRSVIEIQSYVRLVVGVNGEGSER